jgi:hypothetical protein
MPLPAPPPLIVTMNNWSVTFQKQGDAMTVNERLYQNSKGEIVGEKDPDRRILVAAPGAPIDAEFHDAVKAYQAAAEAKAAKKEPAQAEPTAEARTAEPAKPRR